MQAPEIKVCPSRKLIGQRIRTAIAEDKTFQLWRTFMPRRKEITNAVGADLISMQIHDADKDFNEFTPHTEFGKWAAVEVSDFNAVPDGMETFVLPQGLYAVFNYKGRPADFAPMFHYIFHQWLPASGYRLDKRPHFEVLGSKYKNDSPDSEEEIWIPIVKKC